MLKGARVTLRALNRDDLPRLWAFNNDIEVELAGGGDPPMPQSLERLQADFDRDSSKGGRDDAYFGIEFEGRLVGHCGLHGFDMTAHTCELGIGIGEKGLWGQGLGREVVKLLVDYAFVYRNMQKVWLRVNGKNERAIRAYEAVGFIEEGRLKRHVWSNGAFDDLVYMGILRDG